MQLTDDLLEATRNIPRKARTGFQHGSTFVLDQSLPEISLRFKVSAHSNIGRYIWLRASTSLSLLGFLQNMVIMMNYRQHFQGIPAKHMAIVKRLSAIAPAASLPARLTRPSPHHGEGLPRVGSHVEHYERP